MALTFEYALIRVIPDKLRGECVNVGLIMFNQGMLDVRMLPTLAKVSALDGRVDLKALLELPDHLHSLYKKGLDHFPQIGMVSVSEKAAFVLDSANQYETEVDRLMKRLVIPNSARYGHIQSHTRITQKLKRAFQKNKVLGNKLSDISNYLVVQNFPISADENLYAEFALKNAKYHLTETADFRSESLGFKEKSRVASYAAIKFVEADKVYKRIGCNKYVIYAAKSDNEVRGQLALLANHSDGLINVKSRAEMAAYMDKIMTAASHTHALPK